MSTHNALLTRARMHPVSRLNRALRTFAVGLALGATFGYSVATVAWGF